MRHLLEKNPEERFRSAYDLAFDLEALSGSSLGMAGPAAAAVGAERRSATRWLWPLAVAAALLAGFFARGDLDRGSSAPTRVDYRLTSLTDRSGAEAYPAISPAGDLFAFVRDEGLDTDVFVQRVGGQNPTNLTAECEKEDFSPAFSPDGKSIAYRSECAGGGIFVMGATGGSPRRVADFGYDPAFSPDGQEMVVSTQPGNYPFGRGDFAEFWAVRLETGEKRPITRHDAVKPNWSPGGKRIAFWGLKGDSAQRDLWTVAADGSEADREPPALLDDAPVDWMPVWEPDGKSILFLSDRGGTMAVHRLAVDEATGRPAGAPEPAAPSPATFVRGFSVARDGRVAMAAESSVFTLWRAPLDVKSGTVE